MKNSILRVKNFVNLTFTKELCELENSVRLKDGENVLEHSCQKSANINYSTIDVIIPCNIFF